MARKRPITDFGWRIKRKLAELQMDQREFCQKYGIPENRMADLITDTRKATKYRQKVEQILGIECSKPDISPSVSEITGSAEKRFWQEGTVDT